MDLNACSSVRKGRPIALLLSFCFLWTVLCACKEYREGFTATVFDIGDAECILLECDGLFAMIDAGRAYSKQEIDTALSSRGVKQLEFLILTHPHDDHYGSAEYLIQTYKPQTVYAPKAENTDAKWHKLMSFVQESQSSLIFARIGQSFTFSNSTVQILAPSAAYYQEANQYSIVTRIRYGDRSFLFCADAEALNEAELLSSDLSLKSDVIKIAHHGSATSSTAAFLQAVSPTYAIINVTPDNTFGHPSPSVLSQLSACGAKLYRTDRNGTITVHTDGVTLEISTEK